MESEIKDESYPFAKLHMHPEDMAWLRRRWDRYNVACKRLEQERSKENPDLGVINKELLSIKTHKYHICSTVTGRSKGAFEMLREAFGEDVFEWMSEHGINKIKEEIAEKKRKKY